MKDHKPTRRLIAAAALILALAIAGIAAWVHLHRGGHAHTHEHGGAMPALEHGQRWQTDQPLRTGMQRIRDAVAPHVAASGRPMSPAEAGALSALVQEQVAYLVANCKLEPKADAALHVLIADLLAGAQALAADPAAPDGLAKMAEALRRYPEYFDHPGWQPLP